MELSNDQKHEIINSYPFPLAFLYQNLVHHQSKYNHLAEQADFSHTNYNSELLWIIVRNVRLLMRTIGIISVCDYLNGREKLADDLLNQHIFEHISECRENNWYKITGQILENFSKKSKQDPQNKNSIPELISLLGPKIKLPKPPSGFPDKIKTEQYHSWLDVMQLLQNLNQHLSGGHFRLKLPQTDIIKYYKTLLEIAFLECSFLKKYGIYVLVSKDERKTRGFLCQGTRSRPVGIRGIAPEKWHLYKGRPFLSYGQNEYLSLFPFMAPYLQKIGERTGFSDLLLYDRSRMGKLNYFGYRNGKLMDSKLCAGGAVPVLQKELRWLYSHGTKLNTATHFLLNFDYLANFHLPHFVCRSRFYQALFDFIDNQNNGYLCINGPLGSGKTATLAVLYHHTQKNTLEKILPTKTDPQTIFVWHFCAPYGRLDDPVVIIKSLYGQILQKVFTEPLEQIHGKLQKLPDTLASLRKSFNELLEKASSEIEQKKLVVVLDGIDEGDRNSLDEKAIFITLPAHLPLNVILVITFSEENSLFSNLNTDISGSFTAPIHTLDEFSPFPLLTEEEIETWISETDAETETFSDMIYESSTYSPLYIRTLLETVAFCEFSITDFPLEMNALWHSIWQDLPIEKDFLAYKMLCLLAITREYATDEMLSEILQQDIETIAEVRHSINRFIIYNDQHYALTHNYFKRAIINELSSHDFEHFHQQLASYYDCTVEESHDYQNANDQTLLYLGHHYRYANNRKQLFNIAYDDQFKEEKLKRFKSYRTYLKDIQHALLEGHKQNLYEDVLRLSYRYCDLVTEAFRGIAHIFRYTEHGDYQLALERARIIYDENELFKTLLIILWHMIDNEDYEDASMVFEELERIPDDHISYVALNLEPLVIFVLGKVQAVGLLPIHTIIGKHGLKGREAIDHLLNLHDKIEFTEELLTILLGKIIYTTGQLFTSRDKADIIVIISQKIEQTHSYDTSKELWQLLLQVVNTLPELSIRLQCLTEIGRELIKLGQLSYVKRMAQYPPQELEDEDDNPIYVTSHVKYARLLAIAGDIESSKFHLEKAFIAILALEEQHKKNDLYLQIIDDITDIGTFKVTKIHWKRLVALAKQETNYLQLASLVITGLAKLGEWKHAMQVLSETLSSKSKLQATTIFKLTTLLQDSATDKSLIYWEMLLDQTQTLTEYKEQIHILENISKGLFAANISPGASIWKKYRTICDLEEESMERDKILSSLATGFAEQGHFESARKIIAKLSSPIYRAKPIAKIAIHQIRPENLDVALQTIEEVSELREAYQVFAHIAQNIAEGDAGRADWKKLTTAMMKIRTVEHQQVDEQNLLIIIEELANALPLDESRPFWHDIFACIERFFTDEQRVTIIKKILQFLRQEVIYERTTFFWPFIMGIVTDLETLGAQAQIYSSMALTLAHLGQLRETQNSLEQALQCAEQEQNNNSLLKSFAEIAHVYRELGDEKQCRALFERIISKCETSEIHKIKQWNPYHYMVEITHLGLKDLSFLIAEKILLSNVSIGDEFPAPDTLAQIAMLCVDAGRMDWARSLFFQVLPALSQESKNIDQIPTYIYIVQLLEKISAREISLELWEQAQAMILNFPKTSIQERYLETFSCALAKLDQYQNTKSLWKKLLIDARYIGKDLESARCVAWVGKFLLQIAPKEEFNEGFEYVWKILQQLDSEYDKANLTKLLAEALVSANHFDPTDENWIGLIEFPDKWQREDCKNLCFVQLSQILSDRAKTMKNSSLLREAEKLITQISRPQQSCEAYLALAKNCYELNSKEQSQKNLHQATEIGKKLGNFYYSKVLPDIIHHLTSCKQEQEAQKRVDELNENTQKIPLLFDIAQNIYTKGDHKRAQNTFQQAMILIPSVLPQYGERIKMYALAAGYPHLMEERYSSQQIINKAIDNWQTLSGASYQKEAVEYIATALEKLSYNRQTKSIWNNLVTLAEKISQETYRAWALQKIAETYIKLEQYEQSLEILATIPPFREVKLQTLKLYIEKSAACAPLSNIFVLIARLHPEEQSQLIYHLAEGLYQNNKLRELFELLVKFPGDFHLTCSLCLKILSLALKQHDLECFQKWFAQIAKQWGMVSMY